MQQERTDRTLASDDDTTPCEVICDVTPDQLYPFRTLSATVGLSGSWESRRRFREARDSGGRASWIYTTCTLDRRSFTSTNKHVKFVSRSPDVADDYRDVDG